MRAHAQPNGRYDLVIRKHTLPGSKGNPCPFPNSYAPATIRYIFAYILPQGKPTATVTTKGPSSCLFVSHVRLDTLHVCLGCCTLAYILPKVWHGFLPVALSSLSRSLLA
jgi:hypothetical protein